MTRRRSHKTLARHVTVLLAGTAWGVVVLGGAALAANFTVTTNADSGAGSLRDVITAANAAGGDNTITIDAGIGTINLQSNLPLLATSLRLTGNNAAIDGGGTYRGFLISGIAQDGINAAATTVTISGLTLQNVRAKGGEGGFGGGGGLVVQHTDFDVLTPSHWSIGRASGGTSFSMLLGTRGCRRMHPFRSRVRIIW